MSQTKEQSSNPSLLQITEGPYEAIPIIENIPEEYVYTCIEYYENHIYLGTDVGTLLHYFELEKGNFMLVSELNFSDAKKSRIDKIELLPKIDRALVLSEGRLKLFLLPEFAPAPHIPIMMNVNDFSICRYCMDDFKYITYIYGKNAVKEVGITKKEMKVSNKYEIKSIDKAMITKNSTKLIAAIDNCYSLVDLKEKTVSPLFKVVEEDNKSLSPIIAQFSDDEVLVTCGIDVECSSMGLILNEYGDITQGTVVMEQYPESLVVSYPYVIAQFSNSVGCRIYMMKENEEPQLVQRLSYEDKILNLGKVNAGLKIGNSFLKDVIEKLRYVALVSNIKFREDQEQAFVERTVQETSNLVLFGPFGIFILRKIPFILKIKSYGEETLPLLEDFLNSNASKSSSESLEVSYMRILYVLLKIFHSEHIDTDIIDIWLNHVEYVDIRLLPYVFAFDIFGALWIPNGLSNFAKQLRSLNMVHKCPNLFQTIMYLKKCIKEQYSTVIKELSNVLLSLDMILLDCSIKYDKIELDIFDRTSISEVILQLEKKGNKYFEQLLVLYEMEGNWYKTILLLRKNHPERLISHLKEHSSQLTPEYLKNDLFSDLCMACNNDMKSSLSSLLQLIERFGVNVGKLLEKIENPSDKVLLLEHLAAPSTEDEEFLVDYYGTILSASYEHLEQIFENVIEEYSNIMNYNKPKLKEFFEIKLGKCEEFVSYVNNGQKLHNLVLKRHEIILKKIDQVDPSYVLRACLLSTDDFIKLNDRSKIFNLLLIWNDFLTLEDYLSHYPDEILKIFDHYLSIKDISVFHTFLLRNAIVLNDQSLYVQILQRIPDSANLFILTDVILPMIRKTIQNKVSLKIEKEIIKDKLQTLSNIIQRAQSEN